MKIKLFYSTGLALAVVMASTGCRHHPVNVTAIPNDHGAPVAETNPYNTVNSTTPIENTPPISGTPIAETGTQWDPDHYNFDRDALAAYTIHFKYDSAVIQDDEKASLQSVASALQSDPNAKLIVEGNCDERGTEEYNRSLGERRALAAREALAALGVNPDRVHTISYGKDKPADTGHDDAAWSKNRRDDFVLLHPKAGA